MKKELIQIRKWLTKSLIHENEFSYYQYRDVRDYINKQAFPNRSEKNLNEHKQFKLLKDKNPYQASLQRLMFIDLLILNQK